MASAITITIDIIDRLIFITLLLKGIRCDDDWGDVDYQDEGELLFDELTTSVKTNLIVGPVALIKQWESEIRKKLKPEHRLSVLLSTRKNYNIPT